MTGKKKKSVGTQERLITEKILLIMMHLKNTLE